MDQNERDARILEYYGSQFVEAERLTRRSAGGAIELVRVRELIEPALSPGSRVLDVGGATGVHAAWLAEAGHRVLVIDPVPAQIEIARRHGGFRAEVGDARALPEPDGSTDAVLLFGPLYHLVSRDDRLRALTEARRVLRPGGLVAAAGISRISAIVLQILVAGFRGVPGDALDELIEHGSVAPAFDTPDGRFPPGHYHSAGELADELEAAGFVDVRVTGIEGPGSFALEDVAMTDEIVRAGLTLARSADRVPDLADLSSHLLAIARR